MQRRRNKTFRPNSHAELMDLSESDNSDENNFYDAERRNNNGDEDDNELSPTKRTKINNWTINSPR